LNKKGVCKMNLTLTKPVKSECGEEWTVHIVGEDGLLTGRAGVGNSPTVATKKAQIIIDEIEEIVMEFDDVTKYI
jgi:hypothetical protein